MVADPGQIRRHELKYLITEAQAVAMREHIRPFFAVDRHVPEGAAGYTVNNVYLDTHDLRFYHHVKTRRLRRFKPRVRYYGHELGDWLWLEVKSKHGRTVWKDRRRVPVDDWPAVLFAPPADDGEGGNGLSRLRFEDVVQLHGASPVLHVRYFREPWVSEIDDYGRVTFDRRLRCSLSHGSTALSTPDSDMLFYDDAVTSKARDSLVILEIKTQQNVPWWARSLITKFGLMQRGYSKYCHVIERAHRAAEGRNRRRVPA
jgi:hypothetical protein